VLGQAFLFCPQAKHCGRSFWPGELARQQAILLESNIQKHSHSLVHQVSEAGKCPIVRGKCKGKLWKFGCQTSCTTVENGFSISSSHQLGAIQTNGG